MWTRAAISAPWVLAIPNSRMGKTNRYVGLATKQSLACTYLIEVVTRRLLAIATSFPEHREHGDGAQGALGVAGTKWYVYGWRDKRLNRVL